LYLAAAGVPEEIQKEVCEASDNLRRELRSQGNAIIQEHHVTEERIPICEAWKTPATSQLSTNIPVPMHLWFHGITSTSFDVIGQWLTTINKKSTMSRIIRDKLVAIKGLSLEGFKALEIGMANTDFSTAGYQAENFRCMALIFRWLFSDMADKVQGLLGNNEIKKQMEWASDLIDILPCIVSRAMQSTIVLDKDPTDMERYCKLFLSVITNFQKSFHEDNATKSFTSAPNVGALLGPVFETMKEYPPYRYLWEGGCMGEGFLRSIKSLNFQTSSKSSGWAVSLVEKIYCMDALRRMQEPLDGPAEKNLPHIVGRHKKFCSYKEEEWNKTLNFHRPISAVLLSNGSVVMVRRLGHQLSNSYIGATIIFNDAEGKNVLGGWCCPISVVLHDLENEMPIQENQLEGYLELLLLPMAPLDDNTRSPNTLYHCITNEWTQRTNNNGFQLPTFSKAME
jgi:hypothetical protein